jgi:hypothetical protein
MIGFKPAKLAPVRQHSQAVPRKQDVYTAETAALGQLPATAASPVRL